MANANGLTRFLKSRSKRRQEDTRRRLMKAAYEIIAKRGPEGLSVLDISAAAGISRDLFYNHFMSRDSIHAAVIDATRSFARDVYRGLANQTADLPEALALQLLVYLRLCQADRTWCWFMIRALLSEEDHLSGIGGDVRRALASCAEAGVLRYDPEMADTVVDDLLLAATLKLLRENVPDDYPMKFVRTILRELRIPDVKISVVLSKTSPALKFPAFLEAAA
jgi:AcrR family transcriptional regulator